ncbi:MAG: hypothetical protein IT384_33390 [Deltaproteobacteria bacterium]|nr:hypothetical protein [Deltaproteobacteria bacterium]
MAGRTRASLFALALSGTACLDSAAPIELSSDYDWIVVWPEPVAAGAEPLGVIRRRSSERAPLSFVADRAAPTSIFAYRALELGLTDAVDLAVIDGTPVVPLVGCGPALPRATWSLRIEGEVRSPVEVMPAIEAPAIPCASPGAEVLVLSARSTSPGCATASVAVPAGACTACFPVARSCQLEGAPRQECAKEALPLRLGLDGSVSCLPLASRAECDERPTRGGALASFECARPAPTGALVLDLYGVEGPLPLTVKTIAIADRPPFHSVMSGDSPEERRSGYLADLVAIGGQVVVVEPIAARQAGCDGAPDRLHFLDAEGRLTRTVAAPRACLVELAPDPVNPGGFLGAAIADRETAIDLFRFDAGGSVTATATVRLPPLEDPPVMVLEELIDLVVSGTTGRSFVTAMVKTSYSARNDAVWITWAFDGGLRFVASGRVKDQRFHAAAIASPPSAEPLLAIAEDIHDDLVFFDPLGGEITSRVRRGDRLVEMALGDVVALPSEGRWILLNGGLASGTASLMTTDRVITGVQYFASVDAALYSGVIVGPDRALISATRPDAADPQVELAMLHFAGEEVWFEPRLTSLGRGVAGRLRAGERCPGTPWPRVVWMLLSWTASVVRIDLGCP